MVTLLINKRSCGNLPGNLRDLMLLLRYVITESCLHSCLSFQDLRSYMGCSIEIKGRQYVCRACFFFFFWISLQHKCSHVQELSLLFPGLELNGGDFSQEVSTPQNHLVSDPLHLSQAISLSFSLTVFHLTPLSPTTCLSKPSQLNLYLSLCHVSCMLFPLSSLFLLPCLDTGHAGPATTLPVCLIKMQPLQK